MPLPASPLHAQSSSSPTYGGDAPTRCPTCASGLLARRTNLVFAERLGATAVRVANLHGYECTSCEAVWYTPESAQQIREARRDTAVADYELKVTRIGGRSLGVYLPRDLVRVMDLEPGLLGFASRVDEDTIAIRFERGANEDDEDPITDDLVLQ